MAWEIDKWILSEYRRVLLSNRGASTQRPVLIRKCEEDAVGEVVRMQ